MNMKQKGFTLVEMIVVIAIIGILAAVIIPTAASFINRARLSNDRVEARNMSSVLESYLILNDNVDITDLEAPDIRTIVNEGSDPNYSFEPRTAGNSFWFNAATGRIELRSSYEASGGSFTLYDSQPFNIFQRVQAQTITDPGDKLEELFAGFLLLDRGGRSTVSQHIYGIRNLRSEAEHSTIVSALATYDKLEQHISTNFSLSNTLFINDFFSFTQAGANPGALNIVFADNIEVIPGNAFAGIQTGLPNRLALPMSVTIIEQSTFTLQSQAVEIIPRNASIQIETGAFRANDTVNASLRMRESAIVLAPLTFSFIITGVVESLYSVTNGVPSYIGKRVLATNSETYVYYDAAHVVIVADQSLISLYVSPGDTHFVSSIPEYKVSITIRENDDEGSLFLDGLHATYRYENEVTIIEVKGYDEQGRLIARGTARYIPSLLSSGSDS